jgi:hypothetical protein
VTIRLSTASRNAAAKAIGDLVDAGTGAGTLKIYSGAQPATGDTAESGTLLATVLFADPGFAAPSSGTINATDPAAVTGVAAGTAGWFRVEDSAGNNVYDGSVTATGGGGDLTLATTTISIGVTVDITALSITMPAS